MPRFEQDFIDKVRDANNIVDIIGQYSDLKGRGDQHMGLCPFPDHTEKTPSFSVSESKQVYHCFGCKKSGNIFTFLETFSGLPFAEALEFLARRASIEIPKVVQPGTQKAPADDNAQLFKVNKFAAYFYYQQLQKLPDNHQVKNYLRQRGLGEALWEEFKLGYAPESWDSLVQYFTAKKVPLAVAEKLGIIRRNRSGKFFDLFRERIMFPIFSLNQEVVGFGGRIIESGEPKYLNSVESQLFKKGKLFYGLNKAAAAIRREDRVFVVEGYMDFLALYSHGVANVVATLGTALTADHVRLLKRWTKNIVLFFDGDQAGRTAAERSLQTFLAAGFVPQVIELPEGQDPDDFIRSHEVGEFLKLADQAQDLFLVTVKHLMAGYRGLPHEKLTLIDKLQPLLNLLNESRLKQLYIDEVAARIDEEPKRLYQWLQPGKATERPKGPVVETKNPEEIQRFNLKGVHRDELLSLRLALKSPDNLQMFLDDEGINYLASTEMREIFSLIVCNHRQDPQSFAKLTGLVVSRVENPENIIDLVNFSPPFREGEGDERIMKECLVRVKERYLQRKSAVLANDIKDAPTPEKLERLMNIQKDRIALKKNKLNRRETSENDEI